MYIIVKKNSKYRPVEKIVQNFAVSNVNIRIIKLKEFVNIVVKNLLFHFQQPKMGRENIVVKNVMISLKAEKMHIIIIQSLKNVNYVVKILK